MKLISQKSTALCRTASRVTNIALMTSSLLFEEPEYRIYYMPAGFLAVWEFESFIYIEHFAVDPALRNSGTGSAMLQELVKQYQKPICLEVELPEDELTRRRIGFYERNGFVFNEYPYIQPPISKGKSPVPLRIMTYKSEITREEFQKMKEILYRRVYKCEARI